MVAKLGTDPWGEKYLENLKTQGVDVSGVELVEDTTGIAQIIVSETGENQIVIVAGANNHLKEDDVERNSSLFKNCKVRLSNITRNIVNKYSSTGSYNATGNAIKSYHSRIENLPGHINLECGSSAGELPKRTTAIFKNILCQRA